MAGVEPERDAYLRQACGSDEALRREVERLLKSDEAAENKFMEPLSRSDAPPLPREAVVLWSDARGNHQRIVTLAGALSKATDRES